MIDFYHQYYVTWPISDRLLLLTDFDKFCYICIFLNAAIYSIIVVSWLTTWKVLVLHPLKRNYYIFNYIKSNCYICNCHILLYCNISFFFFLAFTWAFLLVPLIYIYIVKGIVVYSILIKIIIQQNLWLLSLIRVETILRLLYLYIQLSTTSKLDGDV